MFPKFLLRRLYKKESLKLVENGFQFALHNKVARATITKVNSLFINKKEIDLAQISFEIVSDNYSSNVEEINSGKNLPLAKGKETVITVITSEKLVSGQEYTISINIDVKEIGNLKWDIKDKCQ